MPITTYSDRLEDVLLYRVLRDVPAGFYIDVGANHPERGSVTKLFYDLGWRGINIEPSPTWFAEIVRARPRDINLCFAAGSSNGKVEFHELLGTGLSTVVERFARRHERAGFKRQTYDVAMRTLADICDEFVHGEIHFLTIDVEGAEQAVLQGCDFVRFRPWILLIEATEPLTCVPSYDAWEPLLLSVGYEFIATDGLNRFYLAHEHQELRALLALPVDDYERASTIEERAQVAALKASPTWRLLHRIRLLADFATSWIRSAR